MSARRITIKKIRALFLILQRPRLNIRGASRELHISRNTLKKYLRDIRQFRLGCTFEQFNPKFYYHSLNKERLQVHRETSLPDIFHGMANAILKNGSNRKIEYLNYKASGDCNHCYSYFAVMFSEWCRMNGFQLSNAHFHIKKVAEEDLLKLAKWKRSNNRGKWAKAIVILESAKGISSCKLVNMVGRPRKIIKEWIKRYEVSGLNGLGRIPKLVNEKMKEDIRVKKEKLIKLLHETPKLHGINRTAWTLKTLSRAFEKTYGSKLGPSSISTYLKKEGYAFRKARMVLTSPDPLYREKLSKIKEILSNLKANEKFFSVDEFGPFSIKIKGGRSIVRNGEFKSYPQLQKSKGFLICTAALELSENQVSHFYSIKKNTEEMIKLIDLLVEKYHDQKRIFFSWDAASWHASKNLFAKINEINSKENATLTVELAPLPASAQFLNVIESIFSGMAKAIIHNSNYESVAECKSAIDLYFKERNEYFKNNPKRAGNKIWGKELSSPNFNDAINHKDPKWR